MANSKKRCKLCKMYVPVESGVQPPAGFFCCHEHAIAFANAKVRESNKRQARAKHRADKERLKTKSEWMKEAQAEFNRFIRIRDHNQECISCDKPWQQIESDQQWKVGGAWDAGHFRTRGAAGHLRFNTYNVHRQCKKCNGGGGRFSHKAATVDSRYREKLVGKIGLHRVEKLENSSESRSFDIEYLKRVKRIFAKRARIYKKLFRA